jgi:hypothetical protein
MSVVLKQIYDLVTLKSGFKGRMRLAVMTGISSTRAGEIQDDPEMVSRFKASASEILREDVSMLLASGPDRR